MFESTLSQASPQARVYRTSNDERIVFCDDGIVVMSRRDARYQQMAVTNDIGTEMHIHVPGLDILVAVLRKDPGADAYILDGVDDLYPGISERPFVLTDEITFNGSYQRLPDFVPVTAFLAEQPDASDAYILAILNLESEWNIFSLNGDPYTVGAIGTKQEISSLGSAGIAGVTFSLLDGHRYNLFDSPFDSSPSYLRDQQPIEYHDVEQFRIAMIRHWTIQLSPLAHARRQSA